MTPQPDPNRPFPIQARYDRESRIDYPGFTIPWWLAEIAYEDYSAKYGTTQSLQRMADRGGFGQWELVAHIRNAKSVPKS